MGLPGVGASPGQGLLPGNARLAFPAGRLSGAQTSAPGGSPLQPSKLGPELKSWGLGKGLSPGMQWHTQLSKCQWAQDPKVAPPWGQEGVWAW